MLLQNVIIDLFNSNDSCSSSISVNINDKNGFPVSYECIVNKNIIDGKKLAIIWI